PLYVPVLIFAANAVETASAGLPITAHLSLLTALLALACSLSPVATAAALKISLS
ncbi:MAG: heme exporter protein CcmB, partial [Thiogranum sp.]